MPVAVELLVIDMAGGAVVDASVLDFPVPVPLPCAIWSSCAEAPVPEFVSDMLIFRVVVQFLYERACGSFAARLGLPVSTRNELAAFDVDPV